jgi:anion-transporting  ArsA/GET3 family ATPase
LSKVRLHFVTGKGGTGKSTIAASLALALAAGGRRVLLVEVEGRQGIAQLFDVPPLPYDEVKIATADRGGHVNALAIDTEAAFLEYLDMFYNLGIAGRAMRRIGAVEFATTIAPGLRDVLLTGKIKEIVVRPEKGRQHGYDAVVVDSPPTGRIARFLDVTQAVSDLAKGGPVHSQADGVVKLLHSDLTAIHLVTLLEALPIQETVEAIDELKQLGLPIGSVIVNRNIPAYAPVWPRRASPCPMRTSPDCSPRPSSTRPGSPHAPRAPNNSTPSTCHGSNCPPCATASISAASTNSPKNSHIRASDEHGTPRTRHARDPVRHLQPRRGVLRRRWSRQDHHRSGDGVAGR